MYKRHPNTICDFCKKEFYKRPSSKLKTKGNYCSARCYGDHEKLTLTKTCEVCKKEYHAHKKNQRFCSVICGASRTRKERVFTAETPKNKKEFYMSHFKEKGWDGYCMVEGCFYNSTFDSHRLLEGKNGGTYQIENVYLICPESSRRDT